MQIFRSIQEIPAHYGPSVVTVGNFDGVHRGHRTVIANVIERARELHARSVAVTFDPHPVRVLRPQSGLRLITLPGQKLRLLAQTGIDAILVLPFTPEMSRWSAQEFAVRVLRGALGAVEVQEGENFRFGADAVAGVNDLAALGATLGFQARVHHPTVRNRMEVSSSAVRNAIAEGNMRLARHLLGRPFEIWSSPAPGRGYGSRYTVPTINLADYAELVPADGVYITCIEIDGEIFESVTNVGNRPTFGDPSFAIESHLLNFHPLLLAEETPIHLKFLYRIRPEMQWSSPEALKQQIALDIARARRYFRLQKGMFPSEASSAAE